MRPSRREALVGARQARSSDASGDEHHDGLHLQKGDASSFAAEMHDHMRGMAVAMDTVPMTGDPDRDFLLMMIPHHQGAVNMARSVLVHGRDPITRQIAEDIIASQSTEIAGMRGRLQSLMASPPGPEEYPTLGGTRGAPAGRP